MAANNIPPEPIPISQSPVPLSQIDRAPAPVPTDTTATPTIPLAWILQAPQPVTDIANIAEPAIPGPFAGYSIAVYANGVLLTSQAQSIDFVGNAVVTTVDRNNVTVTINSTGSGGNTDWANIGNINNANGPSEIAIGTWAGNAQGASAVAIGPSAGNSTQGTLAIAIGSGAGQTSQGNSSVAIGEIAGQTAQGIGAVAIGAYAGANNQANNTIILNATRQEVNGVSAQGNSFYVAPVRNDTGNTTNALYYNTSTFEISYGPAGAGGNYGNANVATFLGAFGSNTINTTGTITGGNFTQSGVGNVNGYNAYFANNITAQGTVQATGLIIPAGSGTFYGNTTTGVNALFAGVPGYTELGTNVVAQFAANVDSYAQLNFQNLNSGELASADYILTADNGNNSAYYLDLGLASSTHVDPYFFGDVGFANDGYLTVVGPTYDGPSTSSGPGNLVLGSSNGLIKMFVGNASQANVITTVSSTGLDVVGNITTTTVVTNEIRSDDSSFVTIYDGLNVDGAIETHGNITADYFIGNGSQLTGVTASASSLVNGDNSFVLDADGNVVFEGNAAGQGINRGLVWDYGANANGVNSQVRQDNAGITVRAWTENAGNYAAPVNIVTNQDANTKTWTFDGNGNLTLPGDLRLQSGNIESDTISPAFSSAITGITTGNATVIVTLADLVFEGPFSGTVTISGVTGTTEANGTWGYEAVEISDIQLYTDATLTTPVDGTTWTAYVSGGTAVSVGTYTDLTIQGGNVSISSNANSWEFDTNGDINIPPNATSFETGRIQSANGYPTLLAYGSGGHGGPELDWMDGDNVNDIGNANVIRNTLYLNDEGFYVGVNENNVANTFAGSWIFTSDGTTIFPTLDTQRGDNPSGTITGQTLLFGDATQEAVISTTNGNPTDGINSQRLVINPGEGYDSGEGGDIYLWAGRGGNASGSGGDIKIRGGQGGANTAGGTGGDGGYIRMEAGDTAATGGSPGYVQIAGGVSSTAQGGYANITGGYGFTAGGTVNLLGGYGGQGPGGNVSITGGGSGNGLAEYGNVSITAGASTWSFNNTGNLTAPGNISAVGNITGTNIITAGAGGDIALTGGNVTGANVVSANTVSATGNITGGNLTTTGLITGNRTVAMTGHSVGLGYNSGSTTDTYSIGIGDGAGQHPGYYAIALGLNAGNTQGGGAVAVGAYAGQYTQGDQAVAIGQSAGTGSSIAVAYVSGDGNPTVTVDSTASLVVGMTLQGYTSGFGNIVITSIDINGTDLDLSAPPTVPPSGTLTFTLGQGSNTVAVGVYSGNFGQGINSVAIGNAAGQTNLGLNAVAIGNSAGSTNLDNFNGQFSVAVGTSAGGTNQKEYSVAIGASAGTDTQGLQSVAIGAYAGEVNQGNASISVGYFAGETAQGDSSIAIGRDAGQTSQGQYAVAIGYQAGLTNQANNSIILNATGANLEQVIANTFTVAPVRNDVANVAEILFYNTTSKEITYGNAISVAGNVTGAYILGNGSQLTGVTASIPSQTILPTIQTITVADTSGVGNAGGGGSAFANVTVANTIPVTEYGVIITSGTSSQKYATGALGSIPGTVKLTFTTGLNSAPFTVYAYVTSNAGTYYSNAATGTSGICLLAGTQIALSDGTYKAIEHITYTDKMLSWDFDLGCYAETTALWIKRGETGSQYNLLTFSDGTTLRTFDQHRIFNKQAGAFTYPMTDATPIGTVTVNEHGQEITLVDKQIIVDTIEYYNVITDRHMNLFSDSILTSCRFNNIYPITDMKFVKDDRTLRTRAEFENIPDRFFHGLRLAEQTTDVETVEWYVNRLLATEVSAEAELAV